MPYNNLHDLPDSVKNNLPKHAQEISLAGPKGLNLIVPSLRNT
jgi:hypothetical protein